MRQSMCWRYEGNETGKCDRTVGSGHFERLPAEHRRSRSEHFFALSTPLSVRGRALCRETYEPDFLEKKISHPTCKTQCRMNEIWNEEIPGICKQCEEILPPLAPSHLVHSGETPWDPRAHQNQPRCPLLARPPTTAALCTRFAAVSLPACRLSASELLCARHCFSVAFSFDTLSTHSALLFACTHVAMHARATAAPCLLWLVHAALLSCI